MAVQKFSSNWNGVARAYSDCTIETSYSVYADMDGVEDAYIRVSGLSIYAETASDLESLIDGASILFEYEDDGSVEATELGTYYLTDEIKTGAYSPSGAWMPYFIILSSDDDFIIPNDGSLFTITVSILDSSSDVLYSFTEQCSGVLCNSITAPDEMLTGRVYSFYSDDVLKAGSGYKTYSSLIWRPKADDVFLMQVSEAGYTDSTTPTDMAQSDFTEFFFAVPNYENISSSASVAYNVADVTVTTEYLSSDFNNGTVISELYAAVPVMFREEVDSALKPTLSENMIAVSVSPDASIINNKYTHRQSTITLTPSAEFHYGDSLSYIRSQDGVNKFNGSVSYSVVGVQPGEEYVRPDTGETETAGEESVCAQSIAVVGSKWGLASDYATVTYHVLYYHMPRLSEFSVHRAAVSSTPTAYTYNNVYYKKDDFGAYCLIIFCPDFSSLDNSNEMSMMVQYGTHRASITPNNNVTDYIVVSADTAHTMDVTMTLYDTFYPYGVSSQLRLSTANILIDFLAGGKGMAVGKPATTVNALDIASNWQLLFYQALVGAYSGTSSQDLVAWMHNVDHKLDVLENSQYANGL